MGRAWTGVVARQGVHHVVAHPFHPSTHEDLIADTLLFCWKESFPEQTHVSEGDEIQSQFGRKRHLLQETELYSGKLIEDANAQEKRLEKCLPEEDEEEEEEVGSKDSQFSGKGYPMCNSEPYSFVALLKACAKQKDLHRGREIHDEILSKGLLHKNILISIGLVSMYCKCGDFNLAQDLFDEIPCRSVVSWNTLMDGCIQYGSIQLVVTCFQQMQQECVFPNSVTYVLVLKACSSLGALKKGEELHSLLVSNRLLEKDIFVGTALIDMYAKCGSLKEAEEVFDDLVIRDVVCWNALISGYAQQGQGEQAIKCFEHMRCEGLSPNAVTYICMLKVCGSLRAPLKGQALHADILRKGLLVNVNVGNVLLDMYAKCGILTKAQEVFDELLVQDVVSWSTLVSGYTLQFHPEQALKCFEQMQQKGISPNGITFLCTLKACGSTGASHKGEELHARIVKEGWLRKDIRVANALVDMYIKCGVLPKAQALFDELPARSSVLWTVLITGYAHAGKYDVAFKLYNDMIGDGKEPDLVTFMTLLSACGNGGSLDEGQMYFEVLRGHHDMLPTLEHYIRMVDLLGRAGHLEQAVTLVSKMPFLADLAMWHSLLGACQKWGNVKVGRWAFEHAVQLHEHDASAYVIMSNIYKAANNDRYIGTT